MKEHTSDLIKPVLFVMTSNGVKGKTGIPTGFWLSEVTHPLAKLDAAHIKVKFASIQGGQPPVDGLDLGDATNAHYWGDSGFRSALFNTQCLDDVNPSRYSAIFFAGGMARCGTSRTVPLRRRSRARFTKPTELSRRCATVRLPWSTSF